MVDLILFDGECGLCQRSIRFVAHADRAARFAFAPLQGKTARRVLSRTSEAALQRRAPRSDTVVLVSNGRIFTRSTAALRILARLGWPWKLFAMALLVPRPIRDGVYDFIARHRHRVFGDAAACGVPPATLRERLLD